MTNEALNPALSLSLRLLEQKSYHSLTYELLAVLNEFEEIEDAFSYELFTLSRDIEKREDYSLRRFPMSLDDSEDDENTQLMNRIIMSHKGGVYEINDDQQTYHVLDIFENVKPRRLVLIRGKLKHESIPIVTALFQVYERLVVLLDSKERDNLTHLHNRQTLDLILDQVFDFYSKRETLDDKKYSWVAILDIDHFKEVNDTFGHLYGDEVLIIFSRLIEQTFRHTDFIFRYGGEEFLVIVNRLEKNEVEAALERFRKAVTNYDFSFGSITVSIGYTIINPKISQRVLLELADSALYLAKNNGRNQVVYSDHGDRRIDNANDVEFF